MRGALGYKYYFRKAGLGLGLGGDLRLLSGQSSRAHGTSQAKPKIGSLRAQVQIGPMWVAQSKLQWLTEMAATTKCFLTIIVQENGNIVNYLYLGTRMLCIYA